MASPFEILQVEEDADEAEIKQAYRRRVKEAHPDQGGSVAEFQEVRAAYEALISGEEDSARPVDRDVGDAGPHGATRETRVEYLNYAVLDDYGWSLDDDGLFQNAATTDLAPEDYGRFVAKPEETLLQAAESHGFAWPFACRGGACANCAIALFEGELSMPADHILPQELLERGIRLSCGGVPITQELQVVYNVKHLPDLEDLRLPPGPFEWM